MDPSAHNPFALDDTVGRKRPACDHHDAAQEPSAAKRQATPAKHKANRQDDVLAAIGARVVTERYILDTVGDNRYTREILRRLVALEVVQRTGVGGPSDPFLYKFLRPVAEAEALGKVDPAQQQRSQRIEHKILSFLGEQHGFVLATVAAIWSALKSGDKASYHAIHSCRTASLMTVQLRRRMAAVAKPIVWTSKSVQVNSSSDRYCGLSR